MKKLSLSIAVLLAVLVAAPAFAGNYVHDETTAVNVISADVRAATYTSNDINVRKYHGQGKLVLDAEAQGSGITNTIKVQTSALATGATNSTSGDTDRPLNKSTSGKTKLAGFFTQSGARQVKYVDLELKKNGTIASDKVLTLTLESDESSAPSGTAVGTAGTVLANSVDDAYQTVRFTFTTPVDLSDATVYWVVLTSNYSASDTNFIDWHTTTVASGGTLSAYAPSSWAAVDTEDPVFKIYQYNFADLVSFSAVGNTASLQSKAIDLDAAGIAIRGVSTVAGGSSTGAYSLILIAPQGQQ